MAQSSNRFGLDEINTQLTAPTSNVQVQGPLNTNLTTSTRYSCGNQLNGCSNAFYTLNLWPPSVATGMDLMRWTTGANLVF